MAAMDNTLPTVLGLEIGMVGEEIRDLSLYGLSQQGARALPDQAERERTHMNKSSYYPTAVECSR